MTYTPTPAAPAGETDRPSLESVIASIRPVDAAAATSARDAQDQLAKPPGSLGRLEDIAVQLSSISGACPPPIPDRPAVAVFAGDHGVVASGVTPWPSEVTTLMLSAVASGGAAVNALAGASGASVTAVAVGVANPWEPSPRILDRTIRLGTADLYTGPAMSITEARRAIETGAGVAAELVDAGANALITGDLGIGNTTPAAAIIAALTGRPATEVTGRGTSTEDSVLHRKQEVVEVAVERLRSTLAAQGPDRAGGLDGAEAIATVAEVGGLEHAAIAGFILGGAAARIPVVLDGIAAGAALLVAHALAPEVLGYVIAGHRSVEPGASAALDHLGLGPVIDLGLRLGEGTGALLAMPVVQAAATAMNQMATLAEVGAAPDPDTAH